LLEYTSHLDRKLVPRDGINFIIVQAGFDPIFFIETKMLKLQLGLEFLMPF